MLTKLMRNSRNLFILGALLAAVAFALAFSLLSKAQQSTSTLAAAQPTPIPAPALVAKTDVPAFAPVADIKGAMQYFREVPVRGAVNPDYVKGFSGLGILLAQGTRHLAIKLPAGQQLMTSEFLTNTVAGAIDYSGMLNPGEVAETIALQPIAASNGNVQPGDHVDVLVSYKVGTKNPPVGIPGVDPAVNPPTTWQSQTTLQNLRVLNVAGINYTIALSHQDALVLKWTKDTNGTVDMVVRAGDDSATGKKAKVFHTTPILPTYLLHDKNMVNKFVLP